MFWLQRVWNDIRGSQPSELIFHPMPGTGNGLGVDLRPDECYVELYLESLRLSQARKFATKFNGVVYAFLELARQGEQNAQLAAVSKPEKLTELDQHSLDHTITVSKRLTSGMPWRGGPMDLEIGLFSIKSGNILTPLVNFVTKVSATAGASFVGTVEPFLPLIEEGMDLLTGQKNDTALEVGVATSLTPAKSGRFAIIAAKKSEVPIERVTVDEQDYRLLIDGKPLERGYCVFSLRHTTQKPDFGEIPELKTAFANLLATLKAGKRKEAEDALTMFRLTAITSPDLISKDARSLVSKAQAMLEEGFPGGGIAAATPKSFPSSLAQIGLYEGAH